MHRIAVLLCLLLVALGVAAWGSPLPAGTLAVVVDDGNNLRAFGGPDYRRASVFETLGRGIALRVLRQEGTWSEVETRNGTRGWIHSACLVPAPVYLNDPRNRDDVRCAGEYSRVFDVVPGPGQARVRVELADVATFDGGGGRLLVRDAAGKTLWRGPGVDIFATMDRWSPLFYFCSPIGIYWPSVIGDIDGDGFAEIVATGPQSDVSVSAYTIARWDGRAFHVVRRGDALVETPPGSGRFVWTRHNGAFDDARWIMDVKGLDADGTARASVYEYGPNLPVRFGLARVRFDRDGARLLSWITPLRGS